MTVSGQRPRYRGLFGRGPLRPTVRDDGSGMDDYYGGFWPQQSRQWDSLAHFRHPRHGFYGGRKLAERTGTSGRNGIHSWARRGIAGALRPGRFRRVGGRTGQPSDIAGTEVIPASDIAATLSWQGSSLQPGDFLLVRFGWTARYESLSQPERESLATAGLTAAALAPAREAIEWLWDSGVVAVAADNPAVEAYPFDAHGQSLHADLLALLGVALSELWFLDRLAEDCAADRRCAGFSSPPPQLRGGIGSPANAIALK